MKLPPGFNTAIQLYRYMENHIEGELMGGPDNLIIHYQTKDSSLLGIIDIEVTLGELRSACFKEIADIVIRPEHVYQVASALHERYPSMDTQINSITQLLTKLERL